MEQEWVRCGLSLMQEVLCAVSLWWCASSMPYGSSPANPVVLSPHAPPHTLQAHDLDKCLLQLVHQSLHRMQMYQLLTHTADPTHP